MVDDRTPRDLESALARTVPSDDFSAEATRRALATATAPGERKITPEQFLRKTASDPHLAPVETDTAPLAGFSTTSLVPAQLLEDHAGELKRFEMKGLLGRGGNASVYAVRDNSLGREIALKLLRGQGATQPGVCRRFVHEARVTAMLEHPNIVPIYDIGVTDEGRVYFLMKNVTGATVGEAIRASREGRDVPEEFRTIDGKLRILLKVCDAVAYAHARGFVHQDIKPDNIMLGGFGEVLLLDWGCALSAEERQRNAGAAYGTPAFMSPEQARREGADERSDIYCLGATLYQMVTLEYPTWHEDPERFWELKRAGEFTPLPPAAEARAPAALLEIARKAMAPEAAKRYQSVAEFRAALTGYLAHAESLALTQRARAQLVEAAGRRRDYPFYMAIATRFEQALEMWPENGEAREGLHAARRAHALCALERGDLGLAESLIEGVPGAEQIAEVIAAERRRRATWRRHGTWTLAGAGALAVVLLALSGYYVLDYFRYFGKWQLVFEHDFTDPNADTAAVAFSQFWLTRDEPPVKAGPGGLPLPNTRMIWLRNVRERGNVRLEVVLRWPGTVDGVEMLINSRREQGRHFADCPAGYACQFGGWMNTLVAFSRNDRSQPFSTSNAVPASFESGRTYRLWFQHVGEEASLHVDGRKVFGVVDPLPMVGMDLDRIGIRAWDDVEIHSISVWRMGSPAKASPLIAGDQLVREGLPERAVRCYRHIAADHAGARIAEQALVRAYLAAAQAGLDDTLREAVRADMLRSFPRSRYWPLVLETDSRRAWQAGRYEEALALAREALKRDPMSRIALHLLSDRPGVLPPQTVSELLALTGQSRRIAALDIGKLGVKDLSLLRGLSLISLDCAENEIESLEPLRGMPLRRLWCGRNRVRSLEPLRGMKLTDLDISDNLVTDLTPLRGMPLARLGADHNRIESLEPLRGMALVTLSLGHNLVPTLEPLRSMTRLEDLEFDENPVSDLRPLAGLPLRYLRCSSAKVNSFEGVERLPLEHIEAAFCPVGSIEPLKGLPLRILDISYTQIQDISPLRGNTKLDAFRANGSRIRDIEPLRGLPLTDLQISYTPVADLGPLAGAPLEQLLCARAQVRSFEPLRGAPLRVVSCWATPLASLEPFTDRPPQLLEMDTVALPPAVIERVLQRWLAHGDTVNVRGWRVFQAARRHDVRYLKSVAGQFGGHLYLYVPYKVGFAAADSMARALGGHLLTVTSRTEQEFVRSLIPPEIGVWLGLVTDSAGAEQWCTGEQYEYRDFVYRAHERRPGHAYLLNHPAIWRYWFRATAPLTNGVLVEWEDGR